MVVVSGLLESAVMGELVVIVIVTVMVMVTAVMTMVVTLIILVMVMVVAVVFLSGKRVVTWLQARSLFLKDKSSVRSMSVHHYTS